MELAPIGKIEGAEDLDLGPIVVPIVGYRSTPKGNEEVVTKIKFKRRPPFKYIQDAIAKGLDTKKMLGEDQLDYLTVIVEDEDKEKFLELVFSEDIYVDFITIKEVFQQVIATYTQRPTKRLSGSSSGPTRTKRTTGHAASSQESTSKPSRSATG
jgi:hypothetical protein